MPNFIDHLREEIRTLERDLEADPRFVKFRELRRIEYLYETQQPPNTETDSLTASRPTRRPATREMSPETKRIIDEAKQLLAGQTSPMPLRAMFHEIVEIRGCQIGGSDPVNGLSAILSRSGEFVAHGRSGWTLAETQEPSKTEAPNSSELFGAPKLNGIEPMNL